MLHREILYKFIKQFQKSDCLWNRNHASYYNKSAKEDALFALLIICKEHEHTTLEDVKRQIQNLRAVYRRYRKKVESSASASINYKPTLWYYKHLTFLSGNAEPDSDESDSDNNDDTDAVEPPRGQKRPAGTSIDQGVEPETSVDESATAFGTSVGAQLHQLSKMQRCIAEKLISEVIYHAKMEQLSMNTSINVKGASDAEVLIPKAGPSWYDTNTARDTDTRVQEPTSSTVLTSEEQAENEMDETESAVSFIKMESYDTEDYVIHDEDPCIEITKEELM